MSHADLSLTPQAAGLAGHHARAGQSPLSSSQWAMAAFLVSEASFFSTLIITYLTLATRDATSPTPHDTLSLGPVVAMTFCLLASSVTIHLAARRGTARSTFVLWWGSTIVLAILFLLGTAREWQNLIVEHHLTISRNLFGTAYYTLIGFHALHVTVGVVAMAVVAGLTVARKISPDREPAVELISWYWHFVDAVWIIVFFVVYVLAR
jgi:cytochrome c oxidase subunit 3/cytochrome o ubiquinol oxidase subunit 3